MNIPFLESLGWTEVFKAALATLDPDGTRFEVGRVVGQSKGHYQVLAAPDSTVRAVVASRFHKAAGQDADFPTVGDWVTLTVNDGQLEATIEHVLPRQSLIQRRRSGRRSAEMQPIAANVEYMLIVSSLNEDFDLPRIGRYRSLAHDSGCRAVVLLTKTDLVDAPEDFLDRTAAALPGVEIIAITQTDPESLAPLETFFAPGRSTVLVGSSGVGKSTLTNWLIGTDEQKTQGLSSASRGKHTTTTRDLRVTRFGGVVIDTPGMQEIAEQSSDDGGTGDFADIEALELTCRFTDCQHGAAPGCAIAPALRSGQISAERLAAYASARRRARGKPSRRSRN